MDKSPYVPALASTVSLFFVLLKPREQEYDICTWPARRLDQGEACRCCCWCVSQLSSRRADGGDGEGGFHTNWDVWPDGGVGGTGERSMHNISSRSIPSIICAAGDTGTLSRRSSPL
jgi:hypothetical protein